MINPHILLEIFAKLIKLIIYYIFHLFRVINHIFMFSEGKLNLYKLTHVIFISNFCPQKFNSRDPMVPFDLSFTAERKFIWLIYHLALFSEAGDTYVKVKTLLT